MRTWLLVGSLAAGVILFVYEWYKDREREQYESGYGHRQSRSFSDEDYIEISENTIPKEVEQRLGNRKKVPGPEEICSICLDRLILKDAEKKYCIIALPQCGHWFHQKCAIRLIEYHPQCPICRVEIDSSSLRTTPVRVPTGDCLDSDNDNSTTITDTTSPSTSSSRARKLQRN